MSPENRKKHGKFISKFMKEFHANRTPEQKAATSKKTSESIKKWHAQRKEEEKKAMARKISKSQTKRIAQIPPRMKKDINRKKSESFRKFDKTPAGREHRKYIGYLSSQDILKCEPERKAIIVEKRAKGLKRRWDMLTPEERKDRLKRSTFKAINKRRKVVECLYEKEVPREKNYCGVVTEQELECMYG